ncbi:MAG: hypothetical protein LIO77_09430 [Rikenellaceae bacterium]|nr:hypothetical protein [Rikenellaceae bacterium]
MDRDKTGSVPRRSYFRRRLGTFFLFTALAGTGIMVYGYMPKYPSRYLYDRSVSYPSYRAADTTAREFDPELFWMIELAGSLYEERDYGGAALVYDKLYSLYPDAGLPEDALYFSGLSYLFSGDPDKAVTLLGAIPLNGSEYSADARWFLALAYLARSENLAARVILEEITGQHENPYAERARELVEQIKTKRWF